MDTANRIIDLNLNDILPNRFQPRVRFNEDLIIDLSESIKKHGVIQPIIVRPIGDKYEIVAGERRYKACVLANFKTIPSIVLNLNDHDSIEVALIENIQRKDLTPIEEAITYKKILDMGYLTQEKLAAKLGKSQSAIANKKRLLNLCDEVQEALMEEKISERHARSLLKLSSASAQKNMLNRIISERLTVRRLDEEIQKYLENETEGNNDGGEKVLTVDSLLKNKDEDKLAAEEVEEEKETSVSDESDMIDISKLFSLMSSSSLKKDGSEKEDMESINISSGIQQESNSKLKEEKEEKIDMINNFQNMDNGMYNNNQQVISSRSFGKFFDPSYFDDNVTSSEEKSAVSDSNFNVQSSSDNIFNQNLLSGQDKADSELNNIPGANNEGYRNAESSVQQMDTNNMSRINNSLTTNQDSTMFPGLINKNEDSSDSLIDEDTLNSFLDPTIIDGQKQMTKPLNNGIIESSVFAKFLDPDYDVKNNSKQANVPDNNQSVVFSTNSNNDTLTSENNTIFDNTSSIQNIPASNETFTNQSSLFMQSNVDNKPDLLAPMGSQTKMTDVNNFASLANEDLANNMTNSGLSMNNNVSQPTLSSQKTELLDEQPKSVLTPDSTINSTTGLLASESMNNNSLPGMSGTEQISSIPLENLVDSNPSPLNNAATVTSELDVEQPVFITATPTQADYSMPTTPIIEQVEPVHEPVNISEPLASTDTSVAPEVVNDSTGEQASSSTSNVGNFSSNNIASQVTNQPIIVTDYEKQYDPILPAEQTPQIQRVEFKEVIRKIRALSDDIEKMGYNVDTDEYDLEDIYQVVFKIDKN